MLKDDDRLPVKPLRVHQLKKMMADRKEVPLPLFLVSFPPGTKMNMISGITSLSNIVCGFRQYYRSKKLKQCYRCQEQGHVKNNRARCGKCAGPH